MRILFDARSVRTPAGRYVFHGLTTGWLFDDRVTAVLAAFPVGEEQPGVADGVEAVVVPRTGWLRHIHSVLPRLADRHNADVVFIPNGVPPRDSRAVIYFQDLFHFEPFAETLSTRGTVTELLRSAWRAYAAPASRLAVTVSSHIHRYVVRQLHIPVTMIPNGIDVGTMRWSGGGDRVVIMGGHGDRKGEEIALRAWAQLARPVRRQHRMEIIGVEPEPRRRRLQQLVDAMNMNGSVTIEGSLHREEFLRRIAQCALAVSCSQMEAFGLPVGEAIAIGAPVLASDLPSHRELMARAGAGRSALVGDANVLAHHLGAALNGSPPPRLTSPPLGWSWRDRAREHVDAYLATA